MKTITAMNPMNVEVAMMIPEFLATQEKLLKELEQRAGLAIDEYKITSPFDSKMRYSIYSFFLVTVAHQRRHLWQAWQVLK